MKRIIGAILISGMWGSAAMTKDFPSALESVNELAGGQNEISIPVPSFRPSPVFDQEEKGFSRQSNPVMEACRGERSCFMTLDGVDRQLCEAYKENRSCFMALDGADAERCERGRFPGKHLFWQHCAD